jgi:hypothetical protein
MSQATGFIARYEKKTFPDSVSIYVNVPNEDMEDLLGVPCRFNSGYQIINSKSAFATLHKRIRGHRDEPYFQTRPRISQVFVYNACPSKMLLPPELHLFQSRG